MAGWHMTRFGRILFILAVSLATVAGSPAGPAHAQAGAIRGFVGVAPDAVAFIQWTESRGYLSGQYQVVYVPERDPLTVESVNMPFTGVRSGASVSLTFSGFLSSTTWTGVLRGSTLTLALPGRDGLLGTLVMKAGTAQDYNRAALALKQRVAHLAEMAARRRAVLDADQAFRRAYQRLANDSLELQRDTDFRKVLEAYAKIWATMQKNYETLRADAAKRPLDCYQLGTVKYDLGTLRYDMGSIRYHTSSFDHIRNAVLGGVAQVRRDIQALQAALQQLRRANEADPARTAPQRYFEQLGGMTVTAVRAADDQVQSSLAALQKAEVEAREFNEKAARLLQEATEFVNGLTCTQ